MTEDYGGDFFSLFSYRDSEPSLLKVADNKQGFGQDEIITIGLYAMQTGIMIICTSFRYCKFKDIGLYSL